MTQAMDPLSQGPVSSAGNQDYYAASLQHILAELERMDLLIRVQVLRARQVQQADPEFQGLCISEAEVDHLLAQPMGLPRWASVPTPLPQTDVRAALEQRSAAIARRNAEGGRRGTGCAASPVP